MVSSRNISRRVFSLLLVWMPLALVLVIGTELAPPEGPSISNEVR
jgi:hypothetical protein